MATLKQTTAPTSLAIKVITSCVLTLNLGFYIAAISKPVFLVAGIMLSLIVLGCYLFWTPVAYELNEGELTVFFRVGRARYSSVIKCSFLNTPLGFGLRLCGNGGLFAGSGIFWSCKLGVFRAYVTTNKPGTLVLVETPKKKIVISPADPPAWLTASLSGPSGSLRNRCL